MIGPIDFVTDSQTAENLVSELGPRAESWLHDVNPYEHHPVEDVVAMIPPLRKGR